MQRPDLSNVNPTILAYIEYLEKKAGIRQQTAMRERDDELYAMPEHSAEPLPAENETGFNVISVSKDGYSKRTLRHLYTRQHRGGMGVFGMDLSGDDEPILMAGVEENQNLLIFTNRARVFRLPLHAIVQDQVNARGGPIGERFGLERDEHMIALLPEQAKGYVALATEGGRVRCLRHHLFGEHMRPGTEMFKYNEVGPLASVCWTNGDADLLLLTQDGMGIRFGEKSISPQGDMGIRLGSNDKVVAITPVYPDSLVFICSADGRGTLRQMTGFAANKSAGGSGKIAIKSNKVVGATVVETNDDLFVVSRLGKVIRFPSSEVPPTEGVVQGVNCMGLRGDEVVAIFKSGPIY
jgi:DNA gyrase subunit A